MAREVAAILGTQADRSGEARDISRRSAPVRVSIEDHALCPRYSALVFENVTVKPSPAWLQQRLEAVGLNPINNIVDVTNYVLAEIAQPMHAFDAAKLHGDEIFVRSARAGETIKALNDESYTLDPSNLVIADPGGPVAIAGIIGGADSAISNSTTRIVLESANFNASSVRKTSSRLKLRTDASMRFEKAQDPVNTIRGLERAFALLQEVSPGIRLVGGLADNYRPLPAPPPIVLPLDWLDRKLGRAVPAEEVRQILESLEFRVEEIEPRVFSVFVPSWRATKDVSIKDDLVEEVGRMIGYDSIPPVAPLTPARVPPASPEREFHHRVREMAAAQGFTEVHNYSFVSEEMARDVFRSICLRTCRWPTPSRRIRICCAPASCRASGRTSTITRATSTSSVCSKSAARFTPTAKCRTSPRRSIAKDDGAAGSVRAQASGRMPAARRLRAPGRRDADPTSIPAAPPTFCTARPTSAVCSSFIPSMSRRRPRRRAGSGSRRACAKLQPEVRRAISPCAASPRARSISRFSRDRAC